MIQSLDINLFRKRGDRQSATGAIRSLGLLGCLILSITLAGCGNNSGDSRSGGGSSQITTTGFAIETMVTKTSDAVGETVEVEYAISDSSGAEVSGFIRFGDGAEIRVTGTGIASYLYPRTGRFQISIQVDTDQSRVIGEITIERANPENQGIEACQPNVEISSGECFVTP